MVQFFIQVMYPSFKLSLLSCQTLIYLLCAGWEDTQTNRETEIGGALKISNDKEIIWQIITLLVLNYYYFHPIYILHVNLKYTVSIVHNDPYFLYIKYIKNKNVFNAICTSALLQ